MTPHSTATTVTGFIVDVAIGLVPAYITIQDVNAVIAMLAGGVALCTSAVRLYRFIRKGGGG